MENVCVCVKGDEYLSVWEVELIVVRNSERGFNILANMK